ncbi:MAG: hypothetical protein MJ151_00540 [Lachnospiraceae bacterium]|nr:hypothetical protein [Lachnospiraceae bacterium]
MNVADFAKENGGGGHKKAAGFTLDMDIESVRSFLKIGLSKLLDR